MQDLGKVSLGKDDICQPWARQAASLPPKKFLPATGNSSYRCPQGVTSQDVNILARDNWWQARWYLPSVWASPCLSLGDQEGKSLEEVTSWTTRQDHPRGLGRRNKVGKVTGDKVTPGHLPKLKEEEGKWQPDWRQSSLVQVRNSSTPHLLSLCGPFFAEIVVLYWFRRCDVPITINCNIS